MMKHFLPRQSFEAIIRSFQELGLETKEVTESFYRQGGVDLEQWGIVASVDALMSLWTHATNQSTIDHVFIRAGMAVPFGSFGIVDHLVRTSATIEEGMLQLQTFIPLISATTSLVYVVEDDTVQIQIHNTPYFAIHDYVDRWLLGMFHRRLTQFLGEEVEVESLYLRPLEETDTSLDQLFGVPVLPHPLWTGLQIDLETWKSPLPTADPLLHKSLLKAANELKFRQFSSSPLSYAVWNTLSLALASRKSVSHIVSEKLGMSMRTLQRRLRKENSSMSALLESYRKQEALRLVSEGLSSLSDISSKLGYNEQSSFNRSFRRWVGLSPRAWRQRFKEQDQQDKHL
ncbi:MAG: hypothetical protein CL920_10965 [Deltaproteobacteria bacterium]|mgnify:CR=1 FL=1|nr:hypothetical protein [Deltaproteobacteria bacterium]MBU49208.1 hypothetical protein [Deltaproteobacteria bacterium]|tara:strand:- start:16712 stop:17743 length:1032 start_codon:yes stop_codon:yes gene_type:complete